jgi:hypothetical protein
VLGEEHAAPYAWNVVKFEPAIVSGNGGDVKLPRRQKLMKMLKISLLVAMLLIIVGAVTFFWRLNAIVRSTLESQAAQQLNVTTTLGSANVNVFGGTVGLHDFAVGSPRGFAAPHMLSVGGADVTVQYGQLRRDPVRIQSISIDQPTLVLEQQNMKFNIKALIDGLPPTPPSDSEALKLIIDRLQVAGPLVVLRPNLPGLPPEITISLPPIELKDVGNADGAQNGAAVRDVVLSLIAALARAADDSGKLPEELRPLLRGDVEAIVRQSVKGVEGEIGKAIDRIKEDPRNLDQIGKDLEKGLKDLVPGKKRD